MILYLTVFKKLAGFAPWARAGILGAAVVFSAFLSLPGESCASVGLRTTLSHQQTETTKNSVSTNSVQQRFSSTMDMNMRFSTKLKMNGRFSVDVIKREDDTRESTELRPNIELRFDTKTFQLSTGYREALRDETVISGVSASRQTTDSKELVADANIRAGRLPDTRLRYSAREEQQERSGVMISDTKSDEVRASLNYRLGIFGMSADYAKQSITNRVPFAVTTSLTVYTTTVTDSTQASGQVHASKALSSRMNISLRENYALSETTRSGTPASFVPPSSSKQSSSTSEARVSMTPLSRTQVSSTYLYTVWKSEGGPGVKSSTTERVWNTSVNYTMPKFFRFYGSYSNREAENSPSASRATTDVTVYGMNFRHRAGRFNMASRYERRINETTNSGPNRKSEAETTTDNFDWSIDASLLRYLSMGLSGSHVTTVTSKQAATFAVSTSMSPFTTTTGPDTAEGTLYRLKANIGPIRNLVATPYIDYSIGKAANGVETISTIMVIPVNYTLNIRDRVRFAFTDNYRNISTETAGSSATSSSNNAVFRVDIPKLLPGTSLSGDASFLTSTTGETTSSTSSYSMRLSWMKRPHKLNANIRYQTGSNKPASTSIGMQYSLGIRMKKVSFSLSSTYRYSITEGAGTPRSTGQMIFVTLSLRN